ncbi:MAG: hypothetical protein LUF27_15750 [Lachnospiraceae bacterium]|nr:hypothetical protein [Lachnospiraceae bacterium]
MEETERFIFTKEELAERVQVSPVVESDLKQIITDRMEQCGLYFRVFSRVKTAASMARKFEQKEYGGERRIQDLVGVRINLYFDDDVEICRHIMEQTFEVVDWSTSERNEDEFKPIKLNGVFRLPEYLRDEISADTWEMGIDDTFEVQIKTMFFEGWHEIEHDMRYKGEELWVNYSGFSRYLNSILATLELCDKSMVTLFEDLGHTLYKDGRWSDMIKSHFRVKMSDTSLYPEVQELLDSDSENGSKLAKKLYKTKRIVLIDQLLRRSRRVPINVNTIIALLNDEVLHDSRLTAIFRKRDVYNDGREESLAESRHYELRPLARQTVFQMCTEVDGSRMKGLEKGLTAETQPRGDSQENSDPVNSLPTDAAHADAEEIFWACVEQIYGWIVKKYGPLFKDMPSKPTTYHADILAYHVAVNLDEQRKRMNMYVRHMDPEVGGRIWYSEASLVMEENPSCAGSAAEGTQTAEAVSHFMDAGKQKRVFLRVSNGYAEAKKDDRPEREGAGIFFSYPGYYKLIVDGIGIYNSIPCSNRRRIVREDGLPALEEAIGDWNRNFPIVVIISRADDDGMMDEDWLGAFRVSDFTRTVWRYAHVLTCYEEVGRKLLVGLRRTPAFAAGRFSAFEAADIPRLYIFWPGGDVDDFGPEDVENCSFGRHLEARSDARTYDIVRGGQAFYHKIVTDLRDWNVSADMWDGFQLEIMTEIPG